MELSIAEKIKILMKRQGMTMGDLADATGQSRQNLSNKMSRDNFSQKECTELAEALGVKYVCYFEMNDGTRI